MKTVLPADKGIRGLGSEPVSPPTRRNSPHGACVRKSRTRTCRGKYKRYTILVTASRNMETANNFNRFEKAARI